MFEVIKALLWINTTQADVGSSSNFNVITAIDSVTVAKEGILGNLRPKKRHGVMSKMDNRSEGRV